MEAITPFITSAELPSAANVDTFHHQHAMIETVCADLIDSTLGPFAVRELRCQLCRVLKVNHRIAVIPVAAQSR